MENQYDLLINGTPIGSFGGSSLLDYAIGETEITNEIFQGMNRSTWELLKSIYGLRKISITIIFKGLTLHDAKMQRSRFNAQIYGKSEIFIPDDGFFYSVYCESMGAEELVGIGDSEAKIKSRYDFKGIRHGKRETVTIPSGGVIFCNSTMPQTDCRLTATAGATAATYTLGSSVFSNVTAGDVLVFDGINKLITKNGTPYAANVAWVHFPFLIPGENTIPCPDAVTVEYFPAYI